MREDIDTQHHLAICECSSTQSKEIEHEGRKKCVSVHGKDALMREMRREKKRTKLQNDGSE